MKKKEREGGRGSRDMESERIRERETERVQKLWKQYTTQAK